MIERTFISLRRLLQRTRRRCCQWANLAIRSGDSNSMFLWTTKIARWNTLSPATVENTEKTLSGSPRRTPPCVFSFFPATGSRSTSSWKIMLDLLCGMMCREVRVPHSIKIEHSNSASHSSFRSSFPCDDRRRRSGLCSSH